MRFGTPKGPAQLQGLESDLMRPSIPIVVKFRGKSVEDKGSASYLMMNWGSLADICLNYRISQYPITSRVPDKVLCACMVYVLWRASLWIILSSSNLKQAPLLNVMEENEGKDAKRSDLKFFK
ncbi:hypothetical protein AAG906_036634 [Vitis piasezkii]